MATLAERLLGSRVEDIPRSWLWSEQIEGLLRPAQLAFFQWERQEMANLRRLLRRESNG